MLVVSSFGASRLSDATLTMSITELLRSSVAATAPSQQHHGRDAQNECDGAAAAQLRRSSSSVAAAAPSQQHYNLALTWSCHRRIPPRGAAGNTSRRDAAQQHLEEGRELLLLRSISSMVVA